jgi:hypothetical protein
MTPTGPPAGTYVDILPIGGLALAFAAPLREFMWEGEARVRLTPFADRFTGTVYERVEARLQADWRPRAGLDAHRRCRPGLRGAPGPCAPGR